MNNYRDSVYPKVTIMIPTYNQENYIEDAIKSALMQDYPNLEVVVGDDCSTDQTGEIAMKYTSDTRIKYFRNEKNLGRVGNYHHIAHDLATGEWAINLDGDDYFISSAFISDAMKCISVCIDKGYPIIAYCYKNPNIEKYQRMFHCTRIDQNSIIMNGKDYFIHYDKIGSFSHPSILYNLKEGKKLGLYKLPILASDFHAIVRLILLGDVVLDKRAIAYWRKHGDNASIKESCTQYEQELALYADLKQFASSYFNENELKQWHTRMNHCAKTKYETNYIYRHKNLKSLFFLIKKFKLDRPYLGLWKQFLLKPNLGHN